MILAPKLFQGTAPEFLYLRYKEDRDSDHVTKFHGNQPTKLEDPVAN